MIIVLSGSNRPRARTLLVAQGVVRHLAALGAAPHLIDLQAMPADLYVPASYETPPDAFRPHQEAVLAAQGIITVVPEYNGSYPGALKYFIDLLEFPESLRGVPCGFVGIASGEWGALRAVEQLEMVFKYRNAHLYGRSVLVREVHKALDAEGRLVDPALEARLTDMVRGFVDFCHQVGPPAAAGRSP